MGVAIVVAACTSTVVGTGQPDNSSSSSTSSSTSSSGASGACPNVAGTWNVTTALTTCGPDQCVITQTLCAIRLVCDQAGTLNGAVSNTSIDYGGLGASCHGTLGPNGRAATLTCTLLDSGDECRLTATKQ